MKKITLQALVISTSILVAGLAVGTINWHEYHVQTATAIEAKKSNETTDSASTTNASASNTVPIIP